MPLLGRFCDEQQIPPLRMRYFAVACVFVKEWIKKDYRTCIILVEVVPFRWPRLIADTAILEMP